MKRIPANNPPGWVDQKAKFSFIMRNDRYYVGPLKGCIYNLKTGVIHKNVGGKLIPDKEFPYRIDLVNKKIVEILTGKSGTFSEDKFIYD